MQKIRREFKYFMGGFFTGFSWFALVYVASYYYHELYLK